MPRIERGLRAIVIYSLGGLVLSAIWIALAMLGYSLAGPSIEPLIVVIAIFGIVGYAIVASIRFIDRAT